MKFRTDFVTNSSSSSFITIIATKKDGTSIEEELESETCFGERIFFSSGIGKLVNAETVDGDEILRNIVEMYKSPRITYLIVDSKEDHPLRNIKNLQDLVKIEFQEEIYGDDLEIFVCYDKSGDLIYPCHDEDGDVFFPNSAKVTVSYDVQNDSYSEMQYTVENSDGEHIAVKIDC